MATTEETINFKPILRIQEDESLKDTPEYLALIWGKNSYGENRNIIVGDNNISYKSNQNFILGNNNKINNGNYAGVFGENITTKDSLDIGLIVGRNIDDVNGSYVYMLGNSLKCPDNSQIKFIFGYNNDAKDNTIVEIANEGNIIEIDKDTGAINLPKITNEDIDNAPDTTLITKSYFNANLNKMNQVSYEAQKDENVITVNIDKYLENSVNIVDIFDLYESNDNIILIFNKNGKTCLGELILKVSLKNFLSSSYEKYIQVNSDNSFINLKVDSTDTIISNDYFLENMISSFHDNESSNIDEYNDGDKVVFKFSIQAELENYILIGPISIYIEYDQTNATQG